MRYKTQCPKCGKADTFKVVEARIVFSKDTELKVTGYKYEFYTIMEEKVLCGFCEELFQIKELEDAS